MTSLSTPIRHFIVPLVLAVLTAGSLTVAACGDGGGARPTACNDSTSSTTEPGPSNDTVVVMASGTLCGDGPQEVVVVREPAETETIGQQIQRDRYAVIRSVEPGEFDIRITIGPVVRLRDGTELRPASDPFQVAFR